MLLPFCPFVVGPRQLLRPTVTNDRRPNGMDNQWPVGCRRLTTDGNQRWMRKSAITFQLVLESSHAHVSNEKMMQVLGCHGVDFKRLLDGSHLDLCHLPLHGDHMVRHDEGKCADKGGGWDRHASKFWGGGLFKTFYNWSWWSPKLCIDSEWSSSASIWCKQTRKSLIFCPSNAIELKSHLSH